MKLSSAAPRARRVGAGLAGAVLVVGAVVALRAWPDDVSAEGDADAGGEVVTAEVEHRALESVQTTHGTVVSSAVAALEAPPLADENALGLAVTGLTHSVGDEIHAGQVVIELNARPVIALPGAIPFFREIRPGDTGPDVESLHVALVYMGYEIPEDELGTFGAASQQAVREIYDEAGYSPLYTLGDHQAVVDAVADAEAGVVDAQVAVGEARAEGSDDLADLESAMATAVDDRDRVLATEGVVVSPHEVMPVSGLPGTLVAVQVSQGDQLEPGVTLARIGSREYQADIALTEAQANEFGPEVEIEVESSGGYVASCQAGTVDTDADHGWSSPAGDEAGESPAEDEPADGGSSDSGEGYRVLVECDPEPPQDSLDDSLRVTMTTSRSDGEAFVVPYTAITNRSSGESFVEVVAEDDPGGGPEEVAVVEVGEAGGFVAVEPIDSGEGRLEEGTRVHVRRR